MRGPAALMLGLLLAGCGEDALAPVSGTGASTATSSAEVIKPAAAKENLPPEVAGRYVFEDARLRLTMDIQQSGMFRMESLRRHDGETRWGSGTCRLDQGTLTLIYTRRDGEALEPGPANQSLATWQEDMIELREGTRRFRLSRHKTMRIK